jgi:hypothetical protein
MDAQRKLSHHSFIQLIVDSLICENQFLFSLMCSNKTADSTHIKWCKSAVLLEFFILYTILELTSCYFLERIQHKQ